MFLVAGSHVDPSADPSADPDPRWSAPPAAAGRPALRTRGLGADSARNSRTGGRGFGVSETRNSRVLSARCCARVVPVSCVAFACGIGRFCHHPEPDCQNSYLQYNFNRFVTVL